MEKVRNIKPAPVALPTAQVFNLADWRKERAKPEPELKTAFPVSDRPGMDMNEIGHGLKAVAARLRDGRMSSADVAKLLDGISANALAACRVGHERDNAIILAHRLLSPLFGNREGKALEKAIRKVCLPKARKKFLAKLRKGKA